MATDPIGMAKDALLQRMGAGRETVEQKIRTDPVANAMFEVAARLIADIHNRKEMISMSKETSVPIASMAGRILAGGNPLDNDQVIHSVVAEIAEANSLAEVTAALKALFGPYFDNMLSLAGSCLAQREDDPGTVGVLTTVSVSYDKIVNAIIGAIEGGSNYWMNGFHCAEDDLSKSLRRAIKINDGIWYAEESFWRDGGKAKVTFDDPTEEGEATKIFGETEIKEGLLLMAASHPRHFADLLNENDDATTHDVFIQCALLGEVVYG